MKHPYEGLNYLEPKKGVWQAVRESVMRSVFPHGGGRNRRRPEAKPELEFRQAALFALGRASVAADSGMRFAMTVDEYESADTIIRTEPSHGAFVYERIQLKEIVPETVDPKQTLEILLQSISQKYGSGEMLTIAIHLNRELLTVLGTLNAPMLPGVTFWLFGLADQNRGFVVKDPFLQFQVYEFDIPKVPASLSQW